MCPVLRKCVWWSANTPFLGMHVELGSSRMRGFKEMCVKVHWQYLMHVLLNFAVSSY